MRSSIQSARISTRDLVIFASISSILLLSRVGLQFIMNVHPLGLIIAATTLTYRKRALIPLYTYIMLDGIFSGFSMWWMPYLYIWLPLWGIFMLLGKLNVSSKVKVPLFMIGCGLHGLLFGLMYAPAQALMFGLSFEATIVWVIAGIPADITHAIGNTVLGSMIIPLHMIMNRLKQSGS